MDSVRRKIYVDCGVQTSARRSPSPFELALTSLTPPRSSMFPDSQSISPNSTTSTRSLNSVQYDSACNSSFKQGSDNSSPVRSKARRQHLSYRDNRPMESFIPEKRVVSLPELGTPLLAVKAALKATTVRVVSLTERPKPVLEDSPSPIRFRSPVFKQNSFLFGDEERSLSCVRSPNSHPPQTPSPPSSPESSILIIENDSQLPRTFLRDRPSLGSHLECSDDEGIFLNPRKSALL
jgi:hypothetical protein